MFQKNVVKRKNILDLKKKEKVHDSKNSSIVT